MMSMISEDQTQFLKVAANRTLRYFYAFGALTVILGVFRSPTTPAVFLLGAVIVFRRTIVSLGFRKSTNNVILLNIKTKDWGPTSKPTATMLVGDKPVAVKLVGVWSHPQYSGKALHRQRERRHTLITRTGKIYHVSEKTVGLSSVNSFDVSEKS
jgi:hypothetical protein